MFQECITYQNQLNSIRSVMRRLRAYKDTSEPQNSLSSACTDKLRVLGENLLDLLLHLAYNVGIMPKVSNSTQLVLKKKVFSQPRFLEPSVPRFNYFLMPNDVVKYY